MDCYSQDCTVQWFSWLAVALTIGITVVLVIRARRRK